MDSRSRSQYGIELVRLTTEQQDRILGGMEHPAIQIETAMEGPKALEPALQQTSSRCLAKKKLKAFNFRLADPQNRLFAESQRERSPPKWGFVFIERFFVPAVSLGGMEHPAIQNETAMEGPRARRARAAADQLAMPHQKKVEGVQFLGLQIRRIDCLLGHKENVLPHMNFHFRREILCSSRFVGRHFHSHRWVLNKIEPSVLVTSNSCGFSRMGDFR